MYNMKNILYLGSKSRSRQRLLNEASIQFKVVEQSADETLCDWNKPLRQLVELIALYKMEHVIIPDGKKENDYCFVLTADTLGIDYQGNICGKPIDKEDAIKKIKAYRYGAETGTAFCLEKRIWKSDKWFSEKRIIKFVNATYIFDIPDDWIERYFELSIASGISYMQLSGAVAVEEFGAQFLKTINGSYTAVVGLPMYELREALIEFEFFK